MVISLAALMGCAGAQRAPESSFREYPRLSKLYVELSYGRAFMNYNPALSVVLKQKIDTYDPEEAVRALQTKIDATAPDIYVIDFTPGPSGDPTFIVYRKEDQTLKTVAKLPGSEMTIPGDGSILVSGIANDYFDRLRKYVLVERTIKEAVQPFYYVGMTTTSTAPLKLYADVHKQDIVEDLPSGSVVEVLLARPMYPNEIPEEGPEPGTRSQPLELPWPHGYAYLVKSPHGLVGWTYADSLCGEELLRGICYHGD